MNFPGPKARLALFVSCYVENILKESSAVKISQGIDSLHRMRISSRRLRCALKIFKALYPQKKIKEWLKPLRRLGKSLGKARQIDVQLRFLSLLKKKSKDPAILMEIENTVPLLRRKRQAAQKGILSTLKLVEKKGTFLEIQNYLRGLSHQKYKEDADNKEIFLERSGNILKKKARKILSFEPLINSPQNTKELHQMRIAVKNLRYSLELFNPIFKNKFDAFIPVMIDIQDILGDFHEYDVWVDFCHTTSSRAHLKAVCEALRADRYRQFLLLWKDLKNKKIWAHLQKAIL
ncbi:MAG: CHAD domain-containing protein [Candidatus Omnitrophota bacterium]